MSEHWSSPGGCHEDCPACEGEARIIRNLKVAYAALMKEEQGAAKDALESLLADDEIEMNTQSDVELAIAHNNLGEFKPALEAVAEALSELGETAEIQEQVDSQFCAMSLCEWESVTERNGRRLCAQCAAAYDLGVAESEIALKQAEKRTDAIVRMFLATFGPYVERDEEIPGSFAVDRIVEFVKALQTT